MTTLRTTGLVLLLTSSPFVQAQFYPKLDPKVLMPILFQGTPTANKNEVMWKPNIGEQKVFLAGEDEGVLTQLDTLYFLGENKDRAVMIFRSFTIDDGYGPGYECGDACAHRIGMATFLQSIDFRTKAKQWSVTDFRKDLAFQGVNEGPKRIDLVKLGKNLIALRIDSYQGDAMQSKHVVSFYPVFAESPILQVVLNQHEVTGGGMEMTDVSVERTMRIISSAQEYFDVEIHEAGAAKPVLYAYDPAILAYGRK